MLSGVGFGRVAFGGGFTRIQSRRGGGGADAGRAMLASPWLALSPTHFRKGMKREKRDRSRE